MGSGPPNLVRRKPSTAASRSTAVRCSVNRESWLQKTLNCPLLLRKKDKNNTWKLHATNSQSSSESGSARLGWYRMSCTSNKCVVLLYLNILKSYYSHYSPPLFAHSITWWITGELTTHQKLNIKPPKKAGLVLNTMHSLNNVPPDQFFSWCFMDVLLLQGL